MRMKGNNMPQAKWLLIAMVLAAGAAAADVSERVSPQITEAINENGYAIAVVVFHEPGELHPMTSAYRDRIASMQQAVMASLDPDLDEVVHRFESVPGMSIRFGAGHSVEALAENPDVRAADLDVGGVGFLNQSRPHVGADLVYQLGLTGSNAIVAVIDSGIDSDHPDLADALVGEHCFVYHPDGGRCPNGLSEQSGSGSAEDDHYHGTHVSGIITGNGTVAPRGVAPAAEIVAVKALDYNNLFYSSSDVTAALDWVYNNRPDVHAVSMSLGSSATFSGYCDSTYSWTIALAAAVNNLWSIGIPCVASSGNAGNNSSVGAPACIENVIAVGCSFDSSDGVATFSNCGPQVDLYAPGSSISATALGGGERILSGTSMSCPHVSAAAALLKERYPALTVTQVVDRLSQSSVSITDRGGYTVPRLELSSVLGPDIDADDMDDAWEQQHFSTYTRDGTGNWDGDAHTDAEEFITGMSPTNAQSVFRVAQASGAAGNLITQWSSVTGRAYRVATSTDLGSNNWSTNAGSVAGSGGMLQATNLIGGSNLNVRITVEKTP
jgi:subtilisin family serine protease